MVFLDHRLFPLLIFGFLSDPACGRLGLALFRHECRQTGVLSVRGCGLRPGFCALGGLLLWRGEGFWDHGGRGAFCGGGESGGGEV